MIDFRYHLVSIVAVFLALGLGLLVGATALQPTALGGLIRLSQQERQQIASALAANRQLSRQIDSNDQFAQGVAPQLLDQLLAGERVVVIEAPGASGHVISGVDQALAQAGAAVSGHVQLQNKFFDTSPSTEQQLSQLAQQFAPAGTSLHGSPVAQASQVIAGAILTRDGPGQPVAGQRDAASVALLSGFGAGGFLNVTGHPDARATLAVVILPDSPQSTSIADPQSQRLVTLAQQLNLTGQGTVVAGSVAGSGPGSAIDVIRNDGARRTSHLSSVDNADHAIGQIVVAQALYEQLRGISGSYGAGAGATGPGPSPAPTPASVQPLPGQQSRPAVRVGKS
jgi:Copper transport outer membrane protein, MctB